MKLESGNVFLLLGSNMGDREKLIENAVKKVEETIGPVVSRSAVYHTAAWGKEDQESFLNIAVAVKTTLAPLAVLEAALLIEEELGRVRQEKWGARLIDIDIILYDNEVVDLPGRLQIPHPEMQRRRFVLEPLSEIAPQRMHPVLNKSVAELLQGLGDNLYVSRINS
ncbi:2-amino-4-hydroxy-6-hydroxymethyldihydropteridine diphosphokinase [Pedobacter faecalis]|uniref:2-amino-4-hydroxy-6- hydroxymethyldihydropteridine diphosphokinase n=1 Tax=Pedobacter faecalis TaxID=3041495 RepID=UPI00254F6260|nr:2-amino-4-hydroxy-6-hydroxymethyldihydropteridine diphosphokinase [Pedobacter sp. ELA7]